VDVKYNEMITVNYQNDVFNTFALPKEDGYFLVRGKTTSDSTFVVFEKRFVALQSQSTTRYRAGVLDDVSENLKKLVGIDLH
jgi:hypothetical protein